MNKIVRISSVPREGYPNSGLLSNFFNDTNNDIVWAIPSKAFALLKNKNIPYVEKIIGQDIAVETLLKEFEVNGLPAPRTAPQVILHGKYVGGYEKLVEHMDSHGMNYNH